MNSLQIGLARFLEVVTWSSIMKLKKPWASSLDLLTSVDDLKKPKSCNNSWFFVHQLLHNCSTDFRSLGFNYACQAFKKVTRQERFTLKMSVQHFHTNACILHHFVQKIARSKTSKHVKNKPKTEELFSVAIFLRTVKYHFFMNYFLCKYSSALKCHQ